MNNFMMLCGNPILAIVIIVAGFFSLGFIVDPEGMKIFFDSFKRR